MPLLRARSLRLAIVGLCFSAPRVVAAQGYPPSQRATITQELALTTITVSYGRPVARGRPLWGALVPWDSIWHPGADSATRVVFSHAVTVEGHPLAAGEYSLWLIPREHAAWSVIFNRAAHVFHKPYPGSATDALRVDVKPEPVSNVETMTIDFPLILRDDGVLRIHWGTLAASVRIKAPYRAPDQTDGAAEPR